MKIPRFTVRDLVLLVVIVALALALAIENRRAPALAEAVEIGDMEIDRAVQLVNHLRAELAECNENFERVDAELQVRESADPR